MHELFPAFYLPIQNSTWIFFLVICIILLAPMFLSRLRIPHIIGMILAGIVVGPYGLGILERDSSFELFGNVGIFYIMFLAGLEMDLEGFKRNRVNGILFGVLTFSIPFASGLLVGQHVLHFSWWASMLMACILASHTLVSYPIVGRYGVNRNPVVTISIAATMLALLTALVILAAISGVFQGNNDWIYWSWFVLRCLLYCVMVIVFVPWISRLFFRNVADNVMQFTYVLAVVFFCGGMAEFCGLEGIFGAFLAGLALNRFIPHVSPLMNRIEFVGNALFIPYFLIGVGMLINISLLFQNLYTVWVVIAMVVAGTLSKLLAAFLGAKLFRRTNVEGWMMFGLTEAHAAGALAMVMVGTRLEVSPGVYLMDDAVLNGVVMMILFSCIISSLATDYASRRMALEQADQKEEQSDDEKILIPMRYPDVMPSLVNMALMMRNPSLNRALIGLTVSGDDEKGQMERARGKHLLEQAVKLCEAADVPMQTHSRLATNIASGVLHALNETESSELVIGMHHKRSIADSFYGALTKSLLAGTFRQLMIVKCLIPVNTLRSIKVIVPQSAEYETGFHRWIDRLSRMAIQLGCRITFFGPKFTNERIENYIQNKHDNVRMAFENMEDWDDLMMLTSQVQEDQLWAFVMARPGSISYRPAFEDLPDQLKYFADASVMLIYPDQLGDPGQQQVSFVAPRAQAQRTLYATIMDYVTKKIRN
ncbi:MAG: cation:proton antiporter [Bacteroidaceae bacterium]|nr:cation:proton antiporter [Bacteroidaceae bacterium]